MENGKLTFLPLALNQEFQMQMRKQIKILKFNGTALKKYIIKSLSHPVFSHLKIFK